MKNLSRWTKTALGLLYIFLISNLILSYISLTAPTSNSEFAALHNFAMGLYAMMIIGLSILIGIFSIPLIKQKRWAYFLNFILIVLLIPVLTVSDLNEIGFDLTQSTRISLIKEVLPVSILLLLILGRKDFKKTLLS